MREHSVPALVKLADDDNLVNVVYEKAVSRAESPVLSRKTADGWQDVSYGEFGALVHGLAKGLLAAGINAGDRVLIFGRTSVEWSAADFALLSVGAVVVPVYPTASAEQVRHIVADSGPVACFAETAEQTELVGVRSWLLGSLDELISLGAGVPDALAGKRRGEVRADDLATIVYTSGTTGLPKGCMLTHRNIFAAAANVVELLDTLFRAPDASTLLFLPLAHVYGRVVQFGCVWSGVHTGLVTSAADLVGELPAFRPTFLVGVPYVLEKIRKAARALTAEQVRGMLGGRLSYVIAGGASLEPSTADYFTELGVQIIGAYGLTEASSTVSMSAPGAIRRGAVGRPVPGTTIAIADDGEILVQGDQVYPGYWPDGGREEWLATGDLGRLDDDGFLHITGRRKEILVTSGGKNVAPAPLEDRVRLHPLVANCMLVGEARPYVAALITLDAAAAGLDDERVRAEISSAVDAANELVSRAESIRRFAILPEDFTVEKGHMTASLRLRRAEIERDYADTIESLYS
ncbi:long-chain fatty acid--CoA ligase [Amycolatopsis sp. GM8]|uniref:AMP-dependent synthetase/ligase n=1 Tax=Amycolatopsis sp. GM8 TaxID=2896530 RepID=UPI001F38B8F0|nr:AMP-dependent synthetase/ligase [Amycolatopsis sp. GM8]